MALATDAGPLAGWPSAFASAWLDPRRLVQPDPGRKVGLC
jgi:hypothetical protein